MNAVSKITKPLVYERIAAVQGELAHTGIGKDSENTFDRYKFRGIDAVYNALAPLLAKHGLCVLPRIVERDCQERTSRKGEPLFYVTVTAEFDFVAAEDGSIHTVRTYGEAMDRSDKATNKAMSAAYKYAAFMTFAIPTEGDNDADASTPEVSANGGSERDNSEARQVSPTGPANQSQGRQRVPREKLDGPHTSWTALERAVKDFDRNLRGCGDSDELEAYLRTTEAAELREQLLRDAPYYLEGGEELPQEYEPLDPLVARLRKDFEDLETAKRMADYART